MKENNITKSLRCDSNGGTNEALEYIHSLIVEYQKKKYNVQGGPAKEKSSGAKVVLGPTILITLMEKFHASQTPNKHTNR